MIVKKVGKKMEIEDLAIMVQRGFEEIHGKFKDTNDRMATKDDLRNLENRLDQKLDVMGARLGSYLTASEKKFDDLHEWVGELDDRVNKIEDKVAMVK